MPGQVAPTIRIEPLDQQHDRGAFCCGNHKIDKWCREQSSKDHEKYRQRVFVACAPNSKVVLGFYSLTIRSLQPRRLLNVGFGQRDIPAVYFAMLGVSESSSKAGIGSALIFDSFIRTLRVADEVGCYCLWLTSVSEEKIGWYEARGFQRIETHQLDMFIPTLTIRDAVKGISKEA